MINNGTHPIQGFALGLYSNFTIAASAMGTAASTVVTSAASAYAARGMEIFNMTGRDIDLVIGKDNGTASYSTASGVGAVIIGNGTIFCPSNATLAIAAGRAMRMPIAFSQSMPISVRTTTNVPITCSSTSYLVINFWE